MPSNQDYSKLNLPRQTVRRGTAGYAFDQKSKKAPTETKAKKSPPANK